MTKLMQRWLLVLSAALFLAAPRAQAGGEGFYFTGGAAADFSRYTTVVRGGLGFEADLGFQWFFHRNVGLHTGTDLVFRSMSVNSTALVPFMDIIPVGIAFQHPRGVLVLAPFFSLPLGNFNDSGGAISTASFWGLAFHAYSYYNVAENFDLGIMLTSHIGFSSPFSAYTTPSLWANAFGLTTRFQL